MSELLTSREDWSKEILELQEILKNPTLETEELDDLKEYLDYIEKEEIDDKYKTHPDIFINDEIKIFNPEKSPPIIPFKLYDFQREYVNKIYDSYITEGILLNEKTRQMGFSWLYMAFFLWGILFDEAFTGFAMSYKEDLVDDGGMKSTINSLFGKFRFMLNRIDNPYIDTSVIELKYLRIRNIKTDAYIIGESTQSEAGRGGTYKIALWDETARTPKSEDIWPSFQLASKSIHLNSTVFGQGNVFARLRWKVLSPEQVVTSRWTKHPEKAKGIAYDDKGNPTSPYYEAQKKILTPSQLAQEVDINYTTSAEGRVYSKFSESIHIKRIEYDPEWTTILAWDLGVADETFIAIMSRDFNKHIAVVDTYYNIDQEIRFYIDLVQGFEPADLDTLELDERTRALAFMERARERQYRQRINVLGPDALQRGIQSKHSVKEQMKNAHLLSKKYRPMQTRIIIDRILERIELTKMIMDPARNKFHVDDRQLGLIERLNNYVWTKTMDGENKQIPLHNWASHGADAIGYGNVWFLKRSRKVGTKPRGT